METIAIQIPAAERGGTPREMTVRMDDLNAQQRETLQWLPTNRAGTVAILRGPSRTTKMPAHMVAGDNGPVIADFEFQVPLQAIEEDIPGLLDLWRGELVKRKQYLSDREARRAARGKPVTGQVEKRRRGKDAEPVEPAEPVLEAGEQAQVQAEPGAPEPGGDLAQVYRCLPLLRTVEVEGMPGPDALQLDGRIWSALVQVESFAEAGFVLRDVRQALDAAHGLAWRNGDLVEDLDVRIEQAHADVREVHAELAAWLKALRERAPQSTAPPTAPDKAAKSRVKASRPARSLPRITGVPALMDLVRQIYVDLCTATHAAQEIEGQADAYPAWAQQFAKQVRIVEQQVSIAEALQTHALAARMDALEKWGQAMDAVEITPQLSLWSSDEHRRMQRAVEPQVGRAHQWRQAWGDDTGAVVAAVASLLLMR